MNSPFVEIADETDREIAMWDLCQAYERAKHLLDDPRIMRFYGDDLSAMTIEITNALSRQI